MAQVLENVVGTVYQSCNTETNQLDKGLIRFATVSFVKRLLQKRWTFLEAGSSIVTVAKQPDYELTGTGNDCGKILTLKYDGVDFSRRYLDKSIFLRLTDAATADQTAVGCWTIYSLNDHNNPTARFWGTPQVAGKVIEYWYKKKIDASDPMGVLPDDMVDLVMLQMLTMFAKDSYTMYKFAALYKDARATAWDVWKPEGGLPRPIQMTQEQMKRNYARNRALLGSRNYLGTGLGGDVRVVDADGNYL